MSVSEKQNKVNDNSGFGYCKINLIKEFEFAIKKDHLFSHVKGGVRGNQNFLNTELLWGDIDNTHSEIPDEWVTIQQFKKGFKDYKFILYTSKSHQISKDRKPPRDKFHVIFPLDEPITDGEKVKNLHSELYRKYQFFDKSCKDQTHFFIGTDDCGKEMFCNWEGSSIMKCLEEKKRSESSDTTEQLIEFVKPSGSGWGSTGGRNSDLTSIAGTLRNRFEISEEKLTEVLTGINETFDQPLPQDEVLSVGKSVSKYPSGGTSDEFWDVDDKGNIHINQFLLMNGFLKDKGFGIYVVDQKSFDGKTGKKENGTLVVRNQKNIIHPYGMEKLRKVITDHLDEIGRTDVRKVLNEKHKSFFTEFQLQDIGFMDIKFLEDCKDKCHLFFKNGVVEITKSYIKKLDYDQFSKGDKSIWNSQIIDKDIDIMDDSNWVEGDFEKFTKNTMQSLKSTTSFSGTEQWLLNEGEYKSFRTSYGYLVHNFKDPSEPKVVLYIDKQEGVGDRNEGNTGKSTLMKSLKHFKETFTLDGKDFNETDQFSFSGVDVDTKFCVIDDVRSSGGTKKTRDFNFDGLYSKATGDFQVNSKYGKKFTIPSEKSPKIGVTTNHILDGVSTSSDRRMHVVEVGDYYNRQYKKYNTKCVSREFGNRRLFHDWDKDEWNRFYNFGFKCVQEFLKEGLFVPEREDFRRKQLLKTIGDEEVLNWIEWWLDEESLKLTQEEGIGKKELFKKFQDENPSKPISDKVFKDYLLTVADSYGYNYNPHKGGDRWQRKVNRIKEDYLYFKPSRETKQKMDLKRLRKNIEEQKRKRESGHISYPWEINNSRN